jgi:hypothetical protein
MQRDDATLLDILLAARRALSFRGDLTEEEFAEDLKSQSSVLHQLMVLGEAVKRLSESTGAGRALSESWWKGRPWWARARTSSLFTTSRSRCATSRPVRSSSPLQIGRAVPVSEGAGWGQVDLVEQR